MKWDQSETLAVERWKDGGGRQGGLMVYGGGWQRGKDGRELMTCTRRKEGEEQLVIGRKGPNGLS